jgi:hypothetical protein
MIWTAPAFGENEGANYAQMIPGQWISRHSPKSLWIAVHRVLYWPDPQVPDMIRCVDLGDVCATFVRSVLEYPSIRPPVLDLATPETMTEAYRHPPQMRIPIFMEEWVPKADDHPVSSEELDVAPMPTGSAILLVHNAQLVHHRTNLGTFVVLATPHSREGESGDEGVSRERLKTAAGLLGAVMGRNAVFESIFDVEMDLKGNAAGVRSPTFENPAAFRSIDFLSNRLDILALCAAQLASLSPDVRHRVRLSLRWLYEAMHEMDGVFAFLKYWIAIETLAMPDGTDIRPVTQQLAESYGKPESEARDFFAVGRLFGLRSEVVHQGLTPRINQHLLAYIEGVYVDLFTHGLGGKSTIAVGSLERSGQSAVDLIAAARRNNREPAPSPP